MRNPTLHELQHPGDGEDDGHHHPFLQHHFEDLGQQHEASTLGMWFFVAQEILFFGGIFMAYEIYRGMYPEDRKSTRLNSSHSQISYAVFCLKKKNISHPVYVAPTHSHPYIDRLHLLAGPM